MIDKFGIYLETNFNLINKSLSCQDVYSKFLVLISKELKIKFSYLVKINPITHSSYNIIDSYSRLYFLKYYKNLSKLIPVYFFYLPFIIKDINDFVENNDTLIIMCPSPISKTIFQIAKRKNKKMILLFRQDIIDMTKNRYFGFKKIFALFFANYYQQYFYRHINNQTIVITSGDKLKNMFLPFTKNVYSIADSRFSIKDIINENNLQKIDIKSKLKFLFIGRLEVNKGVKELLSTALYFKDQITLTIVGDGPMRNEIEHFIINNNLTYNIIYKGFIEFGEELMTLYKTNDFFLFPSYSEGLPQVILEAMANGCFIITTNVGSIPYIIKNGVNGILIKPHNLNNILFTINEILDDKYNFMKIRQNAINSAKIYSFENQFNIFKKLLNE